MSTVDPFTGLDVLKKATYESEPFNFDFTAELSGATITTVVSVLAFSQNRVAGSDELTIGAISNDNQEVQAKIAGGTNGEDYKVRCRITDSAGNNRELVGLLQIRDEV